MKKRIRKYIFYVFLPIAKLMGHIFFDKRYLTGRWFKGTFTGWRWVLSGIFYQKILGFNRNVRWPVTPLSKVYHPNQIQFHQDNLDNFQSPGCYFQASPDAKIIIGKGTYIAPNVGLITSNHDIYHLDNKLTGEDVVIGDDCWIGMNSVILPGVQLGNRTIVAAGAVVTKSFPEGNCVIGGVPAKLIKSI